MTLRSQVAKWAPGPRSAGAIAEITGWDWEYVSETKWGIDGETALRAWNKGRCPVSQAVAAAKACRDSDALAKIIKDRRVAVRVAVLSNQWCPWETLVEKAVYRGRSQESFTVNSTARETLPKAVRAVSFEEAWSKLREGQDRCAFVAVAGHPELSDEHIDMVLSSELGLNTASLIAEHGKLGRLSSESLVKLMEADTEGTTNLYRFAACGAKERDKLVREAMRIMSARGKTGEGWILAQATGVTPETHRAIRDWMTSECNKPLNSIHMSNPESPWQLWVEADVSKKGAADALGRAVADLWGDDPEVWRLVFELLQDFKGSVREMLLWLSIYHPNERLDGEIEDAV